MSLPTTMQALVKSRREPGLWLEEVPVPAIGVNDVLIRVERASICGTDVHILKWDAWASRTIPVPMVIGHEFVGTVAAVGENVSDFFPGQLVSGEGHVVCGHCRNCLAGRRHLCAHTSGVGVNRPGCFAEYIALPMTNIWAHSPGIDHEVACIFDPFGNAVHTALTFPVLGEDVLVTGAGPIGIMAAAVARHAGARYVVITDVNPWRLELARKLGVTLAVNAAETDLKDVQRQLGMTEGFDVGMEMSGNPAAFRGMLANMSHGGKIAMLGIPAAEMAIDWNLLIFNMITLKGIYGREMYETWYKMTVMLQSGLNLQPVITHRFGYRDFQQGFDAMVSGEAGKSHLGLAHMKTSLFDLFKVGIGPSSSHTVGPMRAARRFVVDLQAGGLLAQTSTVKAELYGSLALTGIGHGTDRAVLLGLAGEQPDTVDLETVEAMLAQIRQQGRLRLLGVQEIAFEEARHLLFHRDLILPGHPNAMRLTALDAEGKTLLSRVYFSVGGGFIVAEGEQAAASETMLVPYPFQSGDDLLWLGREHGLPMWEIMLWNEQAWRPEAEVRAGIQRLWSVMQACRSGGWQRRAYLQAG